MLEELESEENLNHLEIPNTYNILTHNSDFLNDSEDPVIASGKTSPQIIHLKTAVVQDTNRRGDELFGTNQVFSHASIYVDRPMN